MEGRGGQWRGGGVVPTVRPLRYRGGKLTLRRLVRFRLRTFIAFVSAMTVVLGLWSRSALEQRAAVAQLRATGVEVNYESDCLRKTRYPFRLLEALEPLLGYDWFHDVVE